jgi:hypothetical protein
MILGDRRYDPSFNATKIVSVAFVDYDTLMTTPHTRRSRFVGGPRDGPTKANIKSFRSWYPKTYCKVLGIRFYKIPCRTFGYGWDADMIIHQKEIHYDLIPVWERLSFEDAAEFMGMYEGVD